MVLNGRNDPSSSRQVAPGNTGPSLKPREPPPSLFFHQSPAASHVSLPGVPSPQPTAVQPAAAHPTRISVSIPSASLAGTHVFGRDHSEKVARLRAAQIALAQAWARSEADDAIETREGEATGAPAPRVGKAAGSGEETVRPLKGSAFTEAGTTAAAADARGSRPGSSRGLGARMEEETKADILLARQRREANDRYFPRLSEGVQDVMARLEEVAAAMREVEQESREVWSEEDDDVDKSGENNDRTPGRDGEKRGK